MASGYFPIDSGTVIFKTVESILNGKEAFILSCDDIAHNLIWGDDPVLMLEVQIKKLNSSL